MYKKQSEDEKKQTNEEKIISYQNKLLKTNDKTDVKEVQYYKDKILYFTELCNKKNIIITDKETSEDYFGLGDIKNFSYIDDNGKLKIDEYEMKKKITKLYGEKPKNKFIREKKENEDYIKRYGINRFISLSTVIEEGKYYNYIERDEKYKPETNIKLISCEFNWLHDEWFKELLIGYNNKNMYIGDKSFLEISKMDDEEQIDLLFNFYDSGYICYSEIYEPFDLIRHKVENRFKCIKNRRDNNLKDPEWYLKNE